MANLRVGSQERQHRSQSSDCLPELGEEVQRAARGAVSAAEPTPELQAASRPPAPTSIALLTAMVSERLMLTLS